MLCSGALLEVLDGESAYFDPGSIQAKEKGVPKDSLVVRFGAICLAALGAGVQSARLLLAPWVRCAAYLT